MSSVALVPSRAGGCATLHHPFTFYVFLCDNVCSIHVNFQSFAWAPPLDLPLLLPPLGAHPVQQHRKPSRKVVPAGVEWMGASPPSLSSQRSSPVAMPDMAMYATLLVHEFDVNSTLRHKIQQNLSTSA